MEYLTPIQLLEERLSVYEKALQKSFISFRDKKITEEEHNLHKKNNNPHIFEYKSAIILLKNWQP